VGSADFLVFLAGVRAIRTECLYATGFEKVVLLLWEIATLRDTGRQVVCLVVTNLSEAANGRSQNREKDLNASFGPILWLFIAVLCCGF